MKDVFFTWGGIGDNLVLLGAAYNYYKKLEEKPLIGTDFPFIKYTNYARHVEKLSLKKLKTNFKETMDWLEENKYNPVFISASGFSYLGPSYKNNVTTWPSKHMITRYCERMGIDGIIDIEIPITVENINPVQKPKMPYICVMCGGLQGYKSIPAETVQTVVDFLSKEFLVIQLGNAFDSKLNNAIDFRNCSLISAYSLLRDAVFFIGATGALIHLAKAANCTSVVLQTTGEPEVLTKYNGNIIIKPIDVCNICARNLLDPLHQPCFNDFKCIRNISAHQIISVIKNNFSYLTSKRKHEPQHELAISDKASNLEDYYHSEKVLII